MHHDRQWIERLPVVESQHFDTWIVRPIRVESHNGTAVDHLAAIDAEADLVLAVTDRHRPHVRSGLSGRSAESVTDIEQPV